MGARYSRFVHNGRARCHNSRCDRTPRLVALTLFSCASACLFPLLCAVPFLCLCVCCQETLGLDCYKALPKEVGGDCVCMPDPSSVPKFGMGCMLGHPQSVRFIRHLQRKNDENGIANSYTPPKEIKDEAEAHLESPAEAAELAKEGIQGHPVAADPAAVAAAPAPASAAPADSAAAAPAASADHAKVSVEAEKKSE